MELFYKNIVVLGGTSQIGQAIAHELAFRGASVHLIARNESELSRIATDISIRYQTPVSFKTSEVLNDAPEIPFRSALKQLGRIDGLVVVTGYLPEQEIALNQFSEAKKTFDINYSKLTVSLLPFINYFEEQSQGFLIGISSVAGDRGRASNFIYGSAKAGFSVFLAGLSHYFSKSEVQILDVKPGFVDTKMTFGMKGMFLVASPEKVAKDTLKALEKNKTVCYSPGFWKWIMLIIRFLPNWIFRRLSL